MIHVSDDIEKKVLKVVTPSQSDRKKLEEVVQDLKKQVKQEIAKRNLPASIEIVGSTAKDTYLKNNLDIDLFIVFPTTFSKENIAHNSLSIGRKILKNTEECYAEHPYIRGYFKNYKAEIVPCYKIESASQKLSAVDRTPLHTKYVKEHLHESQKQEVRLFKQFLIGIGCYGAEAEIEGFSGYLCEIVIMKYGSFTYFV
jgi:tRNA nucleotidyltransferase (CCA-adding enzyme)